MFKIPKPSAKTSILIVGILTLTLGRFVALAIEEQSLSTITVPHNSPTFFEIKFALYNREPLRIAFTPALIVTKVDYKYSCKSSRGKEFDGFMVEFRFLTYWGIPTPLHAYSTCDGITYGKVPKNGR